MIHVKSFKKNDIFDLLASDDWPQAVDPDLICQEGSEIDQIIRAEGIIGFCLDENIEDKKFLDFGCGLGYVCQQALERNPKFVVGYDIEMHDWKKLESNLLFTNKWEDVEKNAPYDFILIYDVLDHSLVDPIEILQKINNISHEQTKVYVRNHPWCSRHGSHFYHKLNKAYLQLILTENELIKLGVEEYFTRKIIYPISTYTNWFEKSGFEIIFQNLIAENVENFFEKEIIKQRIRSHYKNQDLPLFQMKICFLDFILKKKLT